jgi:hypothetical protein
MTITELPISEREQAAGFLKTFDLVYTDLNQPNIRIFRFEESGQLLGIGGLEIFGKLALLRSVAVDKEFQGKKAGRFICTWIEPFELPDHSTRRISGVAPTNFAVFATLPGISQLHDEGIVNILSE